MFFRVDLCGVMKFNTEMKIFLLLQIQIEIVVMNKRLSEMDKRNSHGTVK